jgi:hypothetical protein
LFVVSGCLQRESFDREALMDPAACADCHPDEYRDWSGSMHAYATDDPVFIALNEIGQEETGGALGTLCIGCHAPMAVATGATTDGLNLDEVPRKLKGVTCYFCHQVDEVLGDHNGQLHLADDGAFRGGISDPVDTNAHGSIYSPLHDGSRSESSDLCGACHDVVSPSGVLLERTFAEFKESVFATSGPTGVSCSGCHMPGRNGPGATVPGVPERRVHDHGMPGVDIALSQWPEGDVQLAGIERDLSGSLSAKLCVLPPGNDIEVTLDNVLVGHAWPSGVTHARRGWVELIAYDGENVVFESGVISVDEALAENEDDDLWQFRSWMYDTDGNEVHTAWEAASIVSDLIAPAVTNDPTDPRFFHAITKGYTTPTIPDRITMRVLLRPVGLEIIDGLVATGKLDPAVRDRLPTFELDETVLEWTAAMGFGECAE